MQSPLYAQLHSEKLYNATDDDLLRFQRQQMMAMYEFNQTAPNETEKRVALLKSMLAEVGENCWIEPPFHANWGGYHLHFGKNVYANFGLTLVDDTHIYVGDNVLFGPHVTLATAGHPVEPELRVQGYQFNLPIYLERNCWLGAGVIVLPGVRIGENSVIGAGSVVTKDIPANVVAVGNPCKVLRAINDDDKKQLARAHPLAFV